MAIDDNTSYELTGAQVKDLASKIKAKADSSSLAAVATSGSYADLSNKPTIPTVSDGTLTIQQNGTTVGTFTANQSSATTVSLTDTTYSAMTGASSGAAGTSGLVPAPAAGDESKVLSGAGTWVNQSGGSTYTAGNGISISANNEISIDTITTSMVADGAITNDKIASNTITAGRIAAGAVNTSELAANAVTSAKIDWSTLPGRIIAVGQIDVGNIGANSGKETTKNIPTQTDSNYVVILTHAAQVNGYDKCMPTVKYKYTNRFVTNVWNTGSSSSGSILLDYVAIKY